MVIKLIAWSFVIGGLVLAYMCIGLLSSDIADLKREVTSLQKKADVLRLKSDTHDEMVKEVLDRANDLQYQLINLQNNYIRVKRDNETLAHRIAGGKE